MHFLLTILLLVLELFVLGFCVVYFISGLSSYGHGAPYVPIDKKLIKHLLAFANLCSRDVLFDLGSGDGRVLLNAAKHFNIQSGQGFEISAWPYWKSRWAIYRSGYSNIRVYRRSIFSADIHEASCVYLYLFPTLVQRVAKKLAKELQSGTRVACLSFPIEVGHAPEFRLIKSEKIGKLTAYLYERI